MIYYYIYLMWCLFILSLCFYECKRDHDTVGTFVSCFIYCVPIVGQFLFLWVLLAITNKKLKSNLKLRRVFKLIDKILTKKL